MDKELFHEKSRPRVKTITQRLLLNKINEDIIELMQRVNPLYFEKVPEYKKIYLQNSIEYILVKNLKKRRTDKTTDTPKK